MVVTQISTVVVPCVASVLRKVNTCLSKRLIHKTNNRNQFQLWKIIVRQLNNFFAPSPNILQIPPETPESTCSLSQKHQMDSMDYFASETVATPIAPPE